MRQLITIEQHDLQVITYDGKIVISPSQVDALHRRADHSTLSDMKENSRRLIPIEDYIPISKDSILQNELGFAYPLREDNPVLLTESGYLMLTKRLTDDRSWSIERQMINTYFKSPIIEFRPSIESHHSGPEQDVAVASVLTDPSTLRNLLLGYAERVIALEEILQRQEFKVQFYDDVCLANNGQSIQEISKIMGAGEQRLFEFLRQQKLLMSNNLPFQHYIDGGYFKVALKTRQDENGSPIAYHQTLVTGKGFQLIKRRIHFIEDELALTSYQEAPLFEAELPVAHHSKPHSSGDHHAPPASAVEKSTIKSPIPNLIAELKIGGERMKLKL